MNKLSLFLGALLIGVPLVVTFYNYSVHDYIARTQIISPTHSTSRYGRSFSEGEELMQKDEDQLDLIRRSEDPGEIPILKLSEDEVREFARKVKLLMAEKRDKA